MFQLFDVVRVAIMSTQERFSFTTFVLHCVINNTDNPLALLLVLRKLMCWGLFCFEVQPIVTSFEDQLITSLQPAHFRSVEQSPTLFVIVNWCKKPGDECKQIKKVPKLTTTKHHLLCSPGWTECNQQECDDLKEDEVCKKLNLIWQPNFTWENVHHHNVALLLHFLTPFMETTLFGRLCFKWEQLEKQPETIDNSLIRRKLKQLRDEYGIKHKEVKSEYDEESIVSAVTNWIVYDFMHFPEEVNDTFLQQFGQSIDNLYTCALTKGSEFSWNRAEFVLQRDLQYLVEKKVFHKQQSNIYLVSVMAKLLLYNKAEKHKKWFQQTCDEFTMDQPSDSENLSHSAVGALCDIQICQNKQNKWMQTFLQQQLQDPVHLAVDPAVSNMISCTLLTAWK